MNLLEDAMVACTILDKKTEPDGEGGVVTTWKDGSPFKAAIRFDTSMEARTAAKQGVTSLYTVITNKSVILQYHDVFRREKDKENKVEEKIFRVTSDGDDKATPESSSLDMRVVTAEEWVLK